MVVDKEERSALGAWPRRAKAIEISNRARFFSLFGIFVRRSRAKVDLSCILSYAVGLFFFFYIEKVAYERRYPQGM